MIRYLLLVLSIFLVPLLRLLGRLVAKLIRFLAGFFFESYNPVCIKLDMFISKLEKHNER